MEAVGLVLRRTAQKAIRLRFINVKLITIHSFNVYEGEHCPDAHLRNPHSFLWNARVT